MIVSVFVNDNGLYFRNLPLMTLEQYEYLLVNEMGYKSADIKLFLKSMIDNGCAETSRRADYTHYVRRLSLFKFKLNRFKYRIKGKLLYSGN